MLLSLQTPTERPQNIVVELDDGTELPIQKIYYIGGKSKIFKVLTCDPLRKKRESELEDLKHDHEILQEEEKNAQREISNLEDELSDRNEEREHFKDKIRQLEVDNRALAWNIEQLTTKQS